MQKLALLLMVLLCGLSSVFGQAHEINGMLSAVTRASTIKLPNHLRLIKPYTQSLQKNDRVKAKVSKQAANISLTPPGPTCGHIKIYPVSPEVDPKIVVALPGKLDAAMPTMKALPACSALAKP
jgi:hypothetical protein